MDFSFLTEVNQVLTTDYVALFIIIALGYIIGRIQIKGVSLDISAIIFVAMIFGHYGVTLPKVISDIGLVLFIFTIGIQAGPGFFEALRRDGVKMAVIAFIMALTASAAAVGIGHYVYGLELATVSGIITGAMTSTPGLATAKEIFFGATNEGLVGVGYAISYPFGVIGIILILRILPKLLRISLTNEEQRWEDEERSGYPPVLFRHLLVKNPNVFGQSLADISIRRMTGSNVSRVKHGEDAFTPSRESKIFENDLIRVVGTSESLDKAELLIGKATEETIALSKEYEVRTLLVTNKKIVNRPIGELGLQQNYDATIARIRRSGIDITPDPTSRLRYADKIIVACNKENMRPVEKIFGNDQKSLDKNDFLPIALGIFIGVLIGKFTPLGLTGGVLFSALILGRIGKTGPILWTMTGTANNIIRELGLLLFLAYTGISSGSQIVEQLQSSGIEIFWVGIIVSIVPMIAGVIIGRFVYKFNFVTLIGALSGGMTSTPGLAAISPMTHTNAPQIAYATIYPFALVALVIIIKFIAFFL